MPSNQWITFLHKNKGSGLSLSELSSRYQKQRQLGGRFMCCRSESEEEKVSDYVSKNQAEMLKTLNVIGITHVTVDKSRTRDGQLGRFIISFRDAKRQEVCHMTVVCEDSHWDEKKGIREPHFTIDRAHYFYIFDDKTNKLIFRDQERRLSLVPSEIVEVMGKMLRDISSNACQKRLNIVRPAPQK